VLASGFGHTATGSATLPHRSGRCRWQERDRNRDGERHQPQNRPLVARTVHGRGFGGTLGDGSWPGSQTHLRRESHQGRHQRHFAVQTQGPHALELPNHGCGARTQQVDREQDLAQPQPQAHRSKTFKLSRDPKFLEKLTDVVGLYLNPPEKAIVLCVDEKSQIQALQRTQPGLPLKKGRCGTMTHDYKRHGTTTLFAALDVLAGKVIGDCYKRHRHQEFWIFLRRIDREFAGNAPLHLVMDNYGTHKTPEVRAWLKRHPRFVAHYIPTSPSWLNLIERWFAELTAKRVRRDSFLSVQDLIVAIEDFLAAWNEEPKPFVWTATVESILEKLARCRQTLEQIQPGCTALKTGKGKTS
jgi:transposase